MSAVTSATLLCTESNFVLLEETTNASHKWPSAHSNKGAPAEVPDYIKKLQYCFNQID